MPVRVAGNGWEVRASVPGERVDGLVDGARWSRWRTVTGARVEQVVSAPWETCGWRVKHWSGRGRGLSRTTVSGIWWAVGLRSHWSETVELAADGVLIEKIRDIARL